VKHMTEYTDLPPEVIIRFREAHILKEFRKGSRILNQGDFSRETYFILKGCVRSYTIADGEEKTIDFYIEEDAVLPLNYGQDIESVHFLECVEDTIVLVSNEENERRISKEFPELTEASSTLSKRIIEKLQIQFTEYKISTPEERYKHFLQKRPQLVERIPQYQLASYLGVKPESLSRIKRRLSEK